MRLSVLASASLALLLLAACPLSNKTTTVAATIMDMAQVSGGLDPNHSCTPASTPAPDPAAWWTAQSIANKALVSVGFQLWRNLANNGNCQEHKELAYRGFFQYDLSTLAALKTTVSESIGFASKVIPSGATPNASNLCDARSGGLGSLWLVSPAITVQTGMNVLPPSVVSGSTVVSPAPFPPGQKLVAATLPWVAGSLGTKASTSASGAGGAIWTVDVTGPVQTALNNHQAAIQFMLSSSDEAFPRTVPPPASLDCLTLFEIQPMTVTYVGN